MVRGARHRDVDSDGNLKGPAGKANIVMFDGSISGEPTDFEEKREGRFTIYTVTDKYFLGK